MQRLVHVTGWVCLALFGPLAVAQDAAAIRELQGSVNALRAQAGLPALRLDAELSRACTEHAQYMVLNADSSAMQNLGPHVQNARLPGASNAGQRCAKESVLAPRVADLRTALARWMGGLYHRRPILSPAVRNMAVGYARYADGSIATALMLVEEPALDAPGWPVVWPVDGQQNVPLEFEMGEVPTPIPAGRGSAGYPVTLFVPESGRTRIVSASLRVGGREVPVFLASPARPRTEFDAYGVVSLIPQEPLQPGTRYSYRISTELDGTRYTKQGSFTTQPSLAATGAAPVRANEGAAQRPRATPATSAAPAAAAPVRADDGAALDAAIGRPSLVAGTVVHAGEMPGGGTVFLQLENSDQRLVSVMIPAAVWRALPGGTESPGSWRGRQVQVATVPRRIGQNINLPIRNVGELQTADRP